MRANRAVDRLQEIFFGQDRRLALAALTLVIIGAGLLVGAYVAALGPLLAAALSIALVVGLLMLRSTQWGFFAVVTVACLLPFGALPVDIGFRPTFLDLVLVVLYFVWVSAYVTGRRKEFIASPLGWTVFLFMALACASFIAGLTHTRLTMYVLRHFAEILIAIGLFFVVLNTIRTPAQLRQVLQATALAGTFEAAIGIFLYVIPPAWSIRLLSALGRFNYPTGAGVLRYIEDNPELPMRAIGTSVDPNVLGGLMVLIGGLLVPQLFARRPLFRRWISAGMLLLVVTCLYLTYSRAALLGFAAASLLVAVLRYRKLLILLVLAGLLFFLLPQTQDYVTRLIEGLQAQDRATQMRLGEYKDALILISRYPWFGVGFAGTPDIDTYLGVSSAYLLMAEQMGLVGVGVFLLFLVRLYLAVWRGWRRVRAHQNEELEPLMLGAWAGLSGALVAGVLDHYFFNFDFPHSVTLFWLFIGWCAAAAYMALQAPASSVSGGGAHAAG